MNPTEQNNPTDQPAASASSPAAAPAPQPAPDGTPSPVRAARALLKELEQEFDVFRKALPLAIGIDKQIIARRPQTNRKLLRIALGVHAKSARYLKAMEKATRRFDLDGKESGEITDAHRTHAAQMLEERLKKDVEWRKQQRRLHEEQRKQTEAEQRRSEKLAQLAAKFSRR